VPHKFGADSWPRNRPDAMCEEDITLPSIDQLQGNLRNSRRITTGVAAVAVDATPVPVIDRYSSWAAGKTGSCGNQTKTASKRRGGSSHSEGQLRHHAGAAPRLFLGRLLVTCYGRAQNILRGRSRLCRRRLFCSPSHILFHVKQTKPWFHVKRQRSQSCGNHQQTL
jgi:hypothetical protein